MTYSHKGKMSRKAPKGSGGGRPVNPSQSSPGVKSKDGHPVPNFGRVANVTQSRLNAGGDMAFRGSR